MISTIVSAWRAAKAVYPYAVIGYELIAHELRGNEPEPMPLTWKDVDHIRRAQQIPESHKVKKLHGIDSKHR
jgi:hypothetical protein